MALIWKGADVTKKLKRCVKKGMNQTMADASEYAKNNHPWRNRTGTLEGSIRPVVEAREFRGAIVGVWGSVDVNYALPLEVGTGRMPAMPYLRPAADATYKRLIPNIRNCFEGRGSIVRAGRIIARAL